MTRDHHHHHQFYGHHQHQQHHQQQMMNQIQGFDETNHHYFGSNTNMGMMIDFSKQQQHHHHENLLMVNDDDHNHIQNQRQSQGLSLSLSSSNPTNINLQSFELRSQQQQQEAGYSGKSTQSQNLQHSHQVMMMMMMNNNHHQFQIGSSKYLSPTQELLSEFCSLGVKQSDEEFMKLKKIKNQKAKQQDEDEESFDHHHHDNYASTSSKKHVPPLHSLEFMELQKRKSKLISMLEELKRRYGHYREQMRGAVGAFETAVGIGAAEMYTALAGRAMSRHFRCLKDGIISQIQETSQALGEKEDNNQDKDNRGVSIVPRGETPRLKLLDQALRQQKSFRQMSLVDAHPWRPQRGLPERAVTALRAWLFEHFLHPYPSDVDKHILARQTGLSRSQVSNWFINARVRLWKPMIEEMYCEETRIEQDHINHDHDHENNNKNDEVSISILNPMVNIDSKPDPNQLIRIEPESLSSIVTNPTSKITHKNNLNQGAATTSFGSTFDFSLYGNHAVTYASEREGGSTRGVSLTLGLQRNDGNGGVSLAFSPVTVGNQGGALFYGREHMEDCQQGSVQYGPSMLDGDQSQNLPYRNLMGAQLLHDIV